MMRKYTQHYQDIRIVGMDQWTDEQVLAVYELCQSISAHLAISHRDELIDLMMEMDAKRMIEGARDPNLMAQYQHPLPFDDDLENT